MARRVGQGTGKGGREEWDRKAGRERAAKPRSERQEGGRQNKTQDAEDLSFNLNARI